MAERANPEAGRRPPALRRRGRLQVLPLRQLHRRVPAQREPEPLPAQVDAGPADGARAAAAREPRPVALLLLRRLLRAVPARRRPRRDHDEHAPLAHRAVRLHRDLGSCSTARRRRRSRRCSGSRSLTCAGFVGYGLAGGRSLAVYDGAGAFLPESAVHVFDWAMGGALFALLAVNCARMWWFTMHGDERAPRVPLSAYLRHAALLPVHFFTQKRYRQCKNTGPVGRPPGADALLRDDARAHRVLPAADAGGAGGALERARLRVPRGDRAPRRDDRGAARAARPPGGAPQALARVRLDLPRACCCSSR